MCLVHNTKTIGGSCFDPEVIWVDLMGTAVTATPIEIYGKESLKQVSFLAPPWENPVDACASLSAFEALIPGSEDVEVKLRGWSVYPHY
jgi:hypothetical protein